MNIKSKNNKKDPIININSDNELSRTIVLSSDIENEIIGDIINDILFINDFDEEAENNVVNYQRKPIKLIINSFGGSIYDGLGLIGVIENSQTPIHTYCYGSAMSMGLLIMVSGHKRFGHRLSTFMYHECLDQQPFDKLSTLNENIDETKRIMSVYDNFLIERTSLKRKQLDEVKKIKKDWYFNSDDALKFKVIDVII